MSDKTETPPSSPSKPNRKKPYNRPRLLVYGDIREITKTLGGTVGMNDGGGGNDKTGF